MATDTKQITLTYTIAPPPSVDAQRILAECNVPLSAQHLYSIKPETSSSSSATFAYYSAASTAMIQVQKDLNGILTPWKEAIGDKEKHKEDLGKVGYGKGRASRMTAEADANAASIASASETATAAAGDASDTEDEE
ncbi:hypothetical protein P7C73_g1438, partial [Tremellales sp. Uapishka_1]